MVVSTARQFRNIALIGFMGTGKTTVGHLVAEMLRFRMVDTDDLIEKKAGKPIPEIFAEQGEPAFRKMEADTVAELAATSHTVISTGGGLAAHGNNLEELKTHCLTVCLWASPETIWQRVRHQGHRPLLQTPDPLAKIRSLLAQREKFYRQADLLIGTDLRSTREIAAQIAYHWHHK